MPKMEFIRDMYEEDLVEKHLDEDAWADIRARQGTPGFGKLK